MCLDIPEGPIVAKSSPAPGFAVAAGLAAAVVGSAGEAQAAAGLREPAIGFIIVADVMGWAKRGQGRSGAEVFLHCLRAPGTIVGTVAAAAVVQLVEIDLGMLPPATEQCQAACCKRMLVRAGFFQAWAADRGRQTPRSGNISCSGRTS